MSWLYLIFLFSLAYGQVTEEDCRERKRHLEENCRGIDFPRYPPEDVEEFRHACQTTIPAFTCLKNVAEVCDAGTNDIKIKQLTKFLSGLKYVCNESAPINKIIGENILCYMTVIEESRDKCRDLGKLVVKIADIEGLDDFEISECVQMISHYTCSIGHIQARCGAEAGEAFAEAFNSFGLTELFCPEDRAQQIFQQVQGIIGAMEISNSIYTI